MQKIVVIVWSLAILLTCLVVSKFNYEIKLTNFFTYFFVFVILVVFDSYFKSPFLLKFHRSHIENFQEGKKFANFRHYFSKFVLLTPFCLLIGVVVLSFQGEVSFVVLDALMFGSAATVSLYFSNISELEKIKLNHD